MDKFIKSCIIIIVSYILIKVIKYVIDKIFNITKFDVRRKKTIKSIIISISYYVTFFTSVIMILKEYGLIDFDKSTILTGAGLIGVVAGFASQNLIKDVLNGFFILFEKQMKVGDYVIINEHFRGSIEEIGLRSISLRDWDLRRITISNGQIKSIINYSTNKIRVIVHVRVDYEINPLHVIETLNEVCDNLNEEYSDYLIKNMMKEPSNPFSVYGVTDIYKENTGIQYTITGVVEPLKYWSILRDAKLRILLKFREKEIDLAYPRRIIIDHTQSI